MTNENTPRENDMTDEVQIDRIVKQSDIIYGALSEVMGALLDKYLDDSPDFDPSDKATIMTSVAGQFVAQVTMVVSDMGWSIDHIRSEIDATAVEYISLLVLEHGLPYGETDESEELH